MMIAPTFNPTEIAMSCHDPNSGSGIDELADAPIESPRDGATSSRLSTLPAALRGSGSVRTSQWVGTLYGARVSEQKEAKSSGSMCPDATTIAITSRIGALVPAGAERG
jgi:hypothetical protein